jgi:S-adenosylmethionine hydrolase
MGPLVTLLSDFGTRDGYIGAMKGVILSRAPEARLVDLSHDIPPQDVRAGARALREAVPWFPQGSIHLAVVDPGVGSDRRALVVRSQGRLLLGPDNGLLSLAAAPDAQIWVLDRRELFLEPVTATFHGRDVFASVAGHLAAGRAVEDCGSPTTELVRLETPRPRATEPGVLIGEVVHADRFGNLVTCIRRADLCAASNWKVSLEGRELGPIRRSYADVAPGEWLAYWGSSDELEIAVREGSAAGQLVLPFAAEVKLCRQ